MRVLVRFLIAILLVLVVAVVVVGPGRLVAGAEYPFGVGPWGMNGRYCQDMYSLNRLVDEWHRSDLVVATTKEKTTYVALKNALTRSGPEVPRADFTAFFGTHGNVLNLRRMTEEAMPLNTWWNQNCTEAFMEAPSSLNHAWSGMLGHEHMSHYPKNIVHVGNFFRVTR
jgi:hypothetical protein